jgi:hypothetical protein
MPIAAPGERTMNACRTCKWWGRAHRGYCDRIDMAPDPAGSAHAIIEVAVADDHGLEARLRTGPDFGCALHTEKCQ